MDISYVDESPSKDICRTNRNALESRQTLSPRKFDSNNGSPYDRTPSYSSYKPHPRNLLNQDPIEADLHRQLSILKQIDNNKNNNNQNIYSNTTQAAMNKFDDDFAGRASSPTIPFSPSFNPIPRAQIGQTKQRELITNNYNNNSESDKNSRTFVDSHQTTNYPPPDELQSAIAALEREISQISATQSPKSVVRKHSRDEPGESTFGQKTSPNYPYHYQHNNNLRSMMPHATIITPGGRNPDIGSVLKSDIGCDYEMGNLYNAKYSPSRGNVVHESFNNNRTQPSSSFALPTKTKDSSLSSSFRIVPITHSPPQSSHQYSRGVSQTDTKLFTPLSDAAKNSSSSSQYHTGLRQRDLPSFISSTLNQPKNTDKLYYNNSQTAVHQPTPAVTTPSKKRDYEITTYFNDVYASSQGPSAEPSPIRKQDLYQDGKAPLATKNRLSGDTYFTGRSRDSSIGNPRYSKTDDIRLGNTSQQSYSPDISLDSFNYSLKSPASHKPPYNLEEEHQLNDSNYWDNANEKLPPNRGSRNSSHSDYRRHSYFAARALQNSNSRINYDDPLVAVGISHDEKTNSRLPPRYPVSSKASLSSASTKVAQQTDKLNKHYGERDPSLKGGNATRLSPSHLIAAYSIEDAKSVGPGTLSEMSSICEFDSDGEEIEIDTTPIASAKKSTFATHGNKTTQEFLKLQHRLELEVGREALHIVDHDKSIDSSIGDEEHYKIAKKDPTKLGVKVLPKQKDSSNAKHTPLPQKVNDSSPIAKKTDKYGFFGGQQYMVTSDDSNTEDNGPVNDNFHKGSTLKNDGSSITDMKKHLKNTNHVVTSSSLKSPRKIRPPSNATMTLKDKERHKELDKLRNREKKWKGMLDHWDRYLRQKPEKVRDRCRKGIPPAIRGLAWQYLCGVPAIRGRNTELFRLLASEDQKGDPVIMDEIKRDLHRQFPYHEMFAEPDGPGQRDLFAVLKVYSLMRPRDGYCQAQAPLAAVLLMQMPAEAAFWCLLSICDNYLPGYFGPGLEALQLDGQVFYGLLKRFNPSLYRLLKKQGIQPSLIVTEWFMCVYSRTLSWGCVLRIWDLFLSEGVAILFKVGLILFKLAFAHPQSPRAVRAAGGPKQPDSGSGHSNAGASGKTSNNKNHNVFGSLPMLHFSSSSSLTARYPSMYETMGALQALKTKNLNENYLVSEICKLRIPKEVFDKERQYLKKRK